MTLARLALPLIAIAASAPVAPPRDVAGNRMAALVAVKGPGWFAAKDGVRSAMRCTADRHWCARVVQVEHDFTVELYDRVPAAPRPMAEIAIAGDDHIDVALWPHLVVQADGRVLVGAEVTHSTYYSGGAASTTDLTLYAATPGVTEPSPLLSAPTGGSVMIRACFGERDMRERAGACQDLYEFTGTLTIDAATLAGRPRFRLVTRARTFPGRIGRDNDNSAKRLTKRGLVWARDPACSVTRLFSWSDKPAGYAPDRPLPECSDYLSL